MANIDGSHGKTSNHNNNNTDGSLCEMLVFLFDLDQTWIFSTYCGQMERGHGEAFRSFTKGSKKFFAISKIKLLFNKITF